MNPLHLNEYCSIDSMELVFDDHEEDIRLSLHHYVFPFDRQNDLRKIWIIIHFDQSGRLPDEP